MANDTRLNLLTFHNRCFGKCWDDWMYRGGYCQVKLVNLPQQQGMRSNLKIIQVASLLA